MIDMINIITGILILGLNIIPLLVKDMKYYKITLPLSLLIGAIRVLFL